jgi:hypothetical protein
VLARQVGQRAGLGPRHLGPVARRAHEARHDEAAEGARRREHHLAIAQVRRHRARDSRPAPWRRGYQHELGEGQRRADVAGGPGQAHRAAALGVLQHDAFALHLVQQRRIAAPQPHFMAPLGQVGSGGVAAVAAAQDGDLQHPRRRGAPWFGPARWLERVFGVESLVGRGRARPLSAANL